MESSKDGCKAEVKEKFPQAALFILTNLMMERFSTNGISAILALYLNQKLNFDPSISTAIYHTNELLAYSFTIIGAIIGDSFLGLFKTILWMSLVYAIGTTVVAVGAIEALNVPALAFTFIGLVIAVIGSGSTRANLIAFGGNQFEIPEQAAQLSLYFQIQYVVHKIGTILGQILFPVLREEVKCFGMQDCYPLAFGSGAFGMIIAFFVFLIGKLFYVQKATSGNMFANVSKCIITAVVNKFKTQKTNPQPHWLDYAEEKHGKSLVADTKAVVNILVLYIPLPIYWSVSMQVGSRWVFQASKMNGDIGFYAIKPDQMLVLKSVFEILMLPIINSLIYPLLAKVGVKTLLQKMTIGGMLAVTSFTIAGIVELQVESSYISVLWMLPQYWLQACSETFLFVNHITFAYTEAPTSMKSVMTSFVFVVMAIGNLIVVVISGSKLFTSQSVEFFFFAGVLFAFMILFGFLASRYQPLAQQTITDKENSNSVITSGKA